MVAHPWLKGINNNKAGDIDLLLTDNAAGGGTCFGDSGGPNFLGDSNLIAGVSSYVTNTARAPVRAVSIASTRPTTSSWLATFFD